MPEEKTQFLSQEKLDELKRELEDLKNKKIPQIAKRIDEAKQMGDLSENAEYHDARDQMSWAQSRVQEIEYILTNSQVISNTGEAGIVALGSKIKVKVNGNEREYAIVGAQEADPASGKISNESPLGEAFLGRKKGDLVEVEVPAGAQEYRIVSVE